MHGCRVWQKKNWELGVNVVGMRSLRKILNVLLCGRHVIFVHEDMHEVKMDECYVYLVRFKNCDTDELNCQMQTGIRTLSVC